MGPLSRLTRLQQITLISLSDCHHRLGDGLDSRLLTTGRALHKKSWAVIDRPYSLGCATVGALYERPRCIFCAKPYWEEIFHCRFGRFPRFVESDFGAAFNAKSSREDKERVRLTY